MLLFRHGCLYLLFHCWPVTVTLIHNKKIFITGLTWRLTTLRLLHPHKHKDLRSRLSQMLPSPDAHRSNLKEKSYMECVLGCWLVLLRWLTLFIGCVVDWSKSAWGQKRGEIYVEARAQSLTTQPLAGSGNFASRWAAISGFSFSIPQVAMLVGLPQLIMFMWSTSKYKAWLKLDTCEQRTWTLTSQGGSPLSINIKTVVLENSCWVA